MSLILVYTTERQKRKSGLGNKITCDPSGMAEMPQSHSRCQTKGTWNFCLQLHFKKHAIYYRNIVKTWPGKHIHRQYNQNSN